MRNSRIAARPFRILIASCRDFVASYWPNPGTPGSQVRSMYDRLAAAESALLGKEALAGDVLKSNGQTAR